MSPEPAVSVVIPTHDRREAVLCAVRSALAQTVQSVEVVVVDDGSGDGTREALAGLGARVRYVRRDRNGGVSAARNAGIELARAPIVAFLDSDDRFAPSHVQTVCELLARHPEAPLASTAASQEGLSEPFPLVLLGGYTGVTSHLAVRREALVDIGGFTEQLVVAEDTDLRCRLALRGPFALTGRETVERRVSGGSLQEHGRTGGLYLPALLQVATRLRRELTARDATLARAVDGFEASVRGMQAILEGDSALAAAHLGRACELVPELGTRRHLIARRLSFCHPAWHEPAERARLLEVLDSCWPAPAEAYST
jgi:hypothetical protein